MAEWWTYSLEDVLMFSPRVYWRLIEGHNEAVWPLQLVLVALGAVLLLWPRGSTDRTRIAALVLAGVWLFVGWRFFQLYATINWAAGDFAALFYVEAALLAAFAVAGRSVAGPSKATRSCALAIAAYGLVLHPVVAPLSGRPWSASEVFGVMPDPTAIVTLGFCLLATGRARWLLMPIPLGWCAVGGLTLLAMRDVGGLLPIAAAAVAAACCVIDLLRPPRS